MRFIQRQELFAIVIPIQNIHIQNRLHSFPDVFLIKRNLKHLISTDVNKKPNLILHNVSFRAIFIFPKIILRVKIYTFKTIPRSNDPLKVLQVVLSWSRLVLVAPDCLICSGLSEFFFDCCRLLWFNTSFTNDDSKMQVERSSFITQTDAALIKNT